MSRLQDFKEGSNRRFGDLRVKVEWRARDADRADTLSVDDTWTPPSIGVCGKRSMENRPSLSGISKKVVGCPPSAALRAHQLGAMHDDLHIGRRVDDLD